MFVCRFVVGVFEFGVVDVDGVVFVLVFGGWFLVFWYCGWCVGVRCVDEDGCCRMFDDGW